MAEGLSDSLLARLYAGQVSAEQHAVDASKSSATMVTEAVPRMYLSTPADYAPGLSKLPLAVHPSDPLYAKIFRSLTANQDLETTRATSSPSVPTSVYLQSRVQEVDAGRTATPPNEHSVNYASATVSGDLEMAVAPVIYQKGVGDPSQLLPVSSAIYHSPALVTSQMAASHDGLYQIRSVEVNTPATPPSNAALHHTQSAELDLSQAGSPAGSTHSSIQESRKLEVDLSGAETPPLNDQAIYVTRKLSMATTQATDMPVTVQLYQQALASEPESNAVQMVGSAPTIYQSHLDSSRTASPAMAKPVYQTHDFDIDTNRSGTPPVSNISYQVRNIKVEPARTATPPQYPALYQTGKLEIDPSTPPPASPVLYQADTSQIISATTQHIVYQNPVLNLAQAPGRTDTPHSSQVLYTTRAVTAETDDSAAVQMYQSQALDLKRPTQGELVELQYQKQVASLDPVRVETPTTNPPAYPGRDLERTESTPINAVAGYVDATRTVMSVPVSGNLYTTSFNPNLLDPNIIAEILYQHHAQTAVTPPKAEVAVVHPAATAVTPTKTEAIMAHHVQPPVQPVVTPLKTEGALTQLENSILYQTVQQESPQKTITPAELSAIYKSHGINLDLKQGISAAELNLLTAALYTTNRPPEVEPAKNTSASELTVLTNAPLSTTRNPVSEPQITIPVATGDGLAQSIYSFPTDQLIDLSKGFVTNTSGMLPTALYLTSPTGLEKEISKTSQAATSDRNLAGLYASLPSSRELEASRLATAAALENISTRIQVTPQEMTDPAKPSPTRTVMDDLFARIYGNSSRETEASREIILTSPDAVRLNANTVTVEQAKVPDSGNNTTMVSQLYTSPPSSRDLDPNKLMELIAQDNLFKRMYGGTTDSVTSATKTAEQNVADTLAQKMYVTPTSHATGLTDLFIPTVSPNKVSAPVSQQTGLYQCWICYANFTQEMELITHLNIHTTEKLQKCTVCGNSFANTSLLEDHMKLHVAQHECSVCKRKFPELQQLEDHLTTHKAELPHQCILCKKRFAVAANLVEHMKSHTLEKNLECDVCHKKFGRATHLQVHKKTHSGDRPHECHVCHKKFTRSHVLRDHLTIHTGEKRHTCSFCGKKFTGGNDLKRHVRTHTGEKPYACVLCKKTFAQSSHLKDHMKVHIRDSKNKKVKRRKKAGDVAGDKSSDEDAEGHEDGEVGGEGEVESEGEVGTQVLAVQEDGVLNLSPTAGQEAGLIQAQAKPQHIALRTEARLVTATQATYDAEAHSKTLAAHALVDVHEEAKALHDAQAQMQAQAQIQVQTSTEAQPQTQLQALLDSQGQFHVAQPAPDMQEQLKIHSDARMQLLSQLSDARLLSEVQAQLQLSELSSEVRTQLQLSELPSEVRAQLQAQVKEAQAILEAQAQAKALCEAQALMEAQARSANEARALTGVHIPDKDITGQIPAPAHTTAVMEGNVSLKNSAAGGLMQLPLATVADISGGQQETALNLQLHTQPLMQEQAQNLSQAAHLHLQPDVTSTTLQGTLPSIATVTMSLPSVTTLVDTSHAPLPTLSQAHLQGLNPLSPTQLSNQMRETLPGTGTFDMSGTEMVYSKESAVPTQIPTAPQDEGGMFQCWVCFKRFPHQLDLATHINVHMGERERTHMAEPERTHVAEPERTYRCDNCEKTFTTADQLASHIKTHVSTEKPYHCNVCNRSFSRSYHLKDHLNTHTGAMPYECLTCHQRFLRASSLAEHKKMHAPPTPSKDREKDCNVCQKSFSSPQHLSIHMRTHTGERPYVCEVCQKSFTRSHVLKEHMYTHTGEKPHACFMCPKKFAGANDLRRHLRTHTGERPYSCDLCDKTFVQSSHLKDHVRMHTGEKTHKCPVCNKKFLRPYDVKIHARIHTGERPYQCSLCKKGFTQSCGLKTHMKTHGGQIELEESPKLVKVGRPKSRTNKTPKKGVKRGRKEMEESPEPVAEKRTRVMPKRKTRNESQDDSPQEDSPQESDQESDQDDAMSENSLPPKRRGGRGRARKATVTSKVEDGLSSPPEQSEEQSEADTSKESPAIPYTDDSCLPPKRRGRGRPRKAKHTAKALGGLSEPKGDLIQPMLLDTNSSLSDARSPSDTEDNDNADLAKQINNVLANLASDDEDDLDPPAKDLPNGEAMTLHYTTKPIMPYTPSVARIKEVKVEKDMTPTHIITPALNSLHAITDRKAKLLPKIKILTTGANPEIVQLESIVPCSVENSQVADISKIVTGAGFNAHAASILATLPDIKLQSETQTSPIDYHKPLVPGTNNGHGS